MILRIDTRSLLTVVAALIALSVSTASADSSVYLREANDILDKWIARKDVATSLIADTDGKWTIRSTASRLYPALILTARLTNQDLYTGLLRETLVDERRLTSRLSVFPDDYHLKNQGFDRSSRNPQEILINAATYAAGLANIAAQVGPSPWTDRLKGIVDAAFLRADVQTDYAEGALPSDDLRVNGRLLKVLPLLAELYDDEGYLYYARRLGDAYCVSILPKNGGLPAERWNFQDDKSRAPSLILEDAGVSFIEGMVGLYAVEARDSTARADIYRPTLSVMFDVLFDHGLKQNRRFYRRLQPDGKGGYSIDRKRESAHTARVFLAAHHYGILSGNATYSDRAIRALSEFSPESAWTALPAMIEFSGSSKDAASWVESVNLAKKDRNEDAGERLVGLLAMAHRSAGGARISPWRQDVSLTGSQSAMGLTLTVSATTPWVGKLVFPRQLHQALFVGLGFPNGSRIDPDVAHRVENRTLGATAVWSGSLLVGGLSADIRQDLSISVLPIPSAPTAP
ncbi:MAG: hypothetical protein CME19_21855 [Gemmatimonadetes bacterium]|nr:hypothetical protein [Gemmatimonadota bacterium]